MDFKYGDINGKKIDATFRVHGALGNGFQEVIHQSALELEFKIMPLTYFRDVHIAQAMNYLEAYNLEIGFGSKTLEFHRLTNKKFNPILIQHCQKSNL